MDVPETRYARNGDVYLAYQVYGDGPFTFVAVPPVVSHMDLLWEDSKTTRFVERLASFARVIHFDKRGTGLSDRSVDNPTLEERVDDMRAVMDAEHVEEAALGGISEGGLMAAFFAATYPERTRSLVLVNTTARFTGDDTYPTMLVPDVYDQFMDAWAAAWGTPETLTLQLMAPSMAGDAAYLRFLNRYERASSSPGNFREMMRLNGALDIRSLLPTIAAPTLVVHRTGDRAVPVANGRYLADHIPGATFVEVEGDDHLPWIGDQDALLDAVERHLTGSATRQDVDRVLATVLFTDIVGSTDRAVALGDTAWRQLLDRHDRLSAQVVERYRGRVVKSTGDGMLATFDGPARAVRAARDLNDRLHAEGIPIRSGLHTGEVEVRGDDIGGIAVHIGARVSGLAGAGEVLVSSTVKDLVAGSGLVFTDRGRHQLKGIPDSWQVLAAG